jgi:hypothetical protein
MNDVHERFFERGVLFGHFHLDPERRWAAGHAFWNYPNGMRLIEGHYRNGIRSGQWREFAEDGSILTVRDLGDGEYAKLDDVPNLADSDIRPETTILLTEEYGYRHWYWLPDRPLADLLDWWRGIFSVEPWFMSPLPLPGVLIEASDCDPQWKCLFDTRLYIDGHINDDDDSELRLPSGDIVHHRGRDFVRQHYVA